MTTRPKKTTKDWLPAADDYRRRPYVPVTVTATDSRGRLVMYGRYVDVVLDREPEGSVQPLRAYEDLA